jgi:hypothetical protein
VCARVCLFGRLYPGCCMLVINGRRTSNGQLQELSNASDDDHRHLTVMLVEGKIDLLPRGAGERPAGFVQRSSVVEIARASETASGNSLGPFLYARCTPKEDDHATEWDGESAHSVLVCF